MGSTIAFEAQRIVHEAANPISPGETIKAQIRRAARALGYPDGDWRIRSAWYGLAGNWSAAEFERLRESYSAWREKQNRLAAGEARTAAAAFTLIAESMGERHDGLDRETIAEIRGLVSRLRGLVDRAEKR